MFDINLRSHEALIRDFRKLDPKMQHKVALKGLRKAMQVTKMRAKSLAPKLTGEMARGLYVSARSSKDGFVAIAKLNLPRRSSLSKLSKKGYYPVSQETGWKHSKSGKHIPAQEFLAQAIRPSEVEAIMVAETEMMLRGVGL